MKEPVQVCCCSIKGFALGIGVFDIYQALHQFVIMFYIVILYVGLPKDAYALLPEDQSAEFPAIQFFLIYFPRMFIFVTMMTYEMLPWLRLIYFIVRFVTTLGAFLAMIPMWYNMTATLSDKMALWGNVPSDQDVDF